MESTISSLMGAAERGNASAAEALFGALYSELHRLAKHELARHGIPVSLGVTTLLHEAVRSKYPADLREAVETAA
jgi:hypothetical protein